MITACEQVKLACYGGHSTEILPMFSIVKPGFWVTPECVIKLCTPNPCMLTPMTAVSVVKYTEVQVEPVKHNYIIKIKYYDEKGGNPLEEFYVYPAKVWEKVESTIAPLQDGQRPRNPGIIFIGSPGTGKSSMLKILPEYLGLSVVEVSAERVLSKWVGETEKTLSNFFNLARRLQPSAMLIDEADWIIVSPSKSRSGGYSDVSQNVIGIVKRTLAEFYETGAKVLAMFSANVSESEIDGALKREGRCGKPIIIPLPDFEAVYHYLTIAMKIDASTAEKMALDFVNAGYPMADVVKQAREFLETGKYRIEPVKYRGYRRFIVPSKITDDASVSKFITMLEQAYSFSKIGNYGRARVWISGIDSVIALPIAASVIGQIAKKPVVVIDSEQYLYEAIDMVNLLGAVAIVYSNIHGDLIKEMWRLSDFPIIFIGDDQPSVEHVEIDISKIITANMTGVLKLITGVYDIKLEEADIKAIAEKSSASDFLNKLRNIALTGRVELYKHF